MFLDALHVKIRIDGKVDTRAVYTIMGIDLEGNKDILGFWISKDGESSKFWLQVLKDLQNRGVEDIFIACVDGLKGFTEAIESIYPETLIQRCVIHQIRHSLKYVNHKDKREFSQDLRKIYTSANREQARQHLQKLEEKWGDKYPIAVKSWRDNFDELATFFDFPQPIRRLIYTTNSIESYYSQIRKVTKNKKVFPTKMAAKKIIFLKTLEVVNNWKRQMKNWATILNQLAIMFEDRFPKGKAFTQNV